MRNKKGRRGMGQYASPMFFHRDYNEQIILVNLKATKNEEEAWDKSKVTRLMLSWDRCKARPLGCLMKNHSYKHV